MAAQDEEALHAGNPRGLNEPHAGDQVPGDNFHVPDLVNPGGRDRAGGVDHDFNVLEHAQAVLGIGEVAFDDFNARVFHFHRAEVDGHADVGALLEQLQNEMRSHETAAAGDQYLFAVVECLSSRLHDR